MRRLTLLIAVISPVVALDVILESLKQLIDKDSDPCENFYRHVCPLNSTNKLMINMINKETTESGLFDLELFEDLENRFQATTKNLSDLYKNMCEKGQNTELFLKRFAEILDPKLGYCYGPFCFKHIAYDPDCERAGDLLDNVLRTQFQTHIYTLRAFFMSKFGRDVIIAVTISTHLDGQLEEGIELMKWIVEEMKTIAAEQIMKTPWTANNNVTNITLKVLDMMYLKSDYGKMLRDSLDLVIRYELKFRECKQEFDNDPDIGMFCFFYVAHLHKSYERQPPTTFFDLEFEANNIFPLLQFSLHFYYIAKNTEELAAKLGSLGFIAGHELSRTLIKSKKGFETLTYFSQEAQDCIQNQYNATCNEFKEKSCQVHKIQLKEDGADILGLQLAYKILENQYGDQLFDVYEPLNVTYQQLFFYSTVPFLCNGQAGRTFLNRNGSLNSRSPQYITVNAMANHPAFKEAFKCSDDSRMMRSATKQCIIYGKDAPQNKRF